MRNAGSKLILVVDDEPYLREIVAFDLARCGYRTVEAGSGSEAYALFAKDPAAIALVVSDVRMPGGTGLQLLGQIRAFDAARPGFVFMTAFADLSADEALHLGAEAFLRKPVEYDELAEVVAKALVPCADRWSEPIATFEGARPLEWAPALLGGADPEICFGQGGMFLAKSSDLPTCFELVSFALACKDLPSGALVGIGQVRWARPTATQKLEAGLGIEFLALAEPSRGEVVDLLKQRKPVAFIPLGAAPVQI